MACNRWEEQGLLYYSKELDKKDWGEFEEHLKTCAECREEQRAYLIEKESFFTLDILGESPSQSVDDEIHRVAGAKKQYTSVGLFPSLLKKSLFSATFFVLGFIVVSYFVFNMDRFGKTGTVATDAQRSDSLASKTAKAPLVATAGTKGSLRDSLNKDSAMSYSKSRGNLNVNGVVPVVDIKEK